MEVNDSGVGIHDPNVSVEEVSVQSSERSAKKHYCATCNVTLLSNIEHEIHQKGTYIQFPLVGTRDIL